MQPRLRPRVVGGNSDRITREFCLARNARLGRGKFSLNRARRLLQVDRKSEEAGNCSR